MSSDKGLRRTEKTAVVRLRERTNRSLNVGDIIDTGKWLAMLKEIAPNLARVALLANPKGTAYEYFLRNATAAASSLGIEIISSPHSLRTLPAIQKIRGATFPRARGFGAALLKIDTAMAETRASAALCEFLAEAPQ